MSIETGTFLRGNLVGVRDQSRDYSDANGHPKTSKWKEIGIETQIMNSFGRPQTITKVVRISSDKEKDAAFMKSLAENHNQLIEIPVNVGDYKSLYVDSSATIQLLDVA